MASSVGVIGGSGLGDLVGGDGRPVATPYGECTVTVGELGGREVAFIARHGAGHTVPPHRINARANVWALARLGVRAVVSTAAVGSLRPELAPERFAIADQLVDRTTARAGTYFDGADGVVRHVPFAEPFCPELRALAAAAMPDAAPAATVAVIDGPRFSTAAESRILRGHGVDLVNMTLCPEVALAAELGMGTVALCFVTDTDGGISADDPDAASAELVFGRLTAAKPRIAGALERIVGAVPASYAPRPLIDDDAIAAVLARPVVR
ncbi:MTAP family purine nucleoside phosphorylase [Agromyces italicus]|uniref:MTAP family purine nucleoside phosphorylase n=1 Tax=Agromyces italicus TaxID=279572 RepID=UPI0003B43F9C|nr:MTAP family purine nucleoside phosphorylase [Agromyces italicus]